jgi:hypothetical protein
MRFGAPYIGSSAIAGTFDDRLLARRDAAGLALAEVLAKAGRDATAIPLLARARQDLLGYLEVHIEQGPRPSRRPMPTSRRTSFSMY